MRRPKKTTIAKKDADAGMPGYRLSLPILLGLFLFFTIFGGGIAYLAFAADQPEQATGPTELVIATDTVPPDTPTPTDTLVPTETNTPEPQPTLPPIEYIVKEGDSCQQIAGFFNISMNALITSNNLSVNCFIVAGQTLLVPQPTPIPTNDAIATLSARQTEAACPIDYVTVQEGDTIDVISQYTRVPAADILSYNGKPSPQLFAGEVLAIPTCKITTDLEGATCTPSPAPTYQASELIQPSKGTFFRSGDEIILQWLAPAELRSNEFFLVTLVDNTDGGEIILEEAVKDTRYVVPQSAQPEGSSPHVYAWQVSIVALIGEDDQGNPIYREGSLESEPYYFAWEAK